MANRRFHGHTWGRNVLHWLRCNHCGLILLRNRATEKAANRMCPSYEEES